MGFYYKTASLRGNIRIPRIHFHVLDSTNSWVKRHAQELAQYRRICITASEQRLGRGRFGRSWFSPRGGIYVSLFIAPLRGPESLRWDHYLFNLGQMFLFASAQSLIERGFPINIKYPNDIILGGRKVAGILTESCPFREERAIGRVKRIEELGVVIGLGLNVNIPYQRFRELGQPATSLSHFSGREWDEERLLGDIVTRFFLYYEKSHPQC